VTVVAMVSDGGRPSTIASDSGERQWQTMDVVRESTVASDGGNDNSGEIQEI